MPKLNLDTGDAIELAELLPFPQRLARQRRRPPRRVADPLRRRRSYDLYGSALALTAAVQAWSEITDTPVPDLTPEIVR